MKQKHAQPGFGENPDVPFEGDVLNRGEEIRTLTPLIKTMTSPAVMAIDSPWGTGKTAFVKMWLAHLEKEEKTSIRALHFNAWETDFVADPMVSFLAAMEDELSGKQKRKWDAEWRLVKTAGKALLPALINIGVGGRAGELAQKAAEALADEAVDSCGAQTEAIKNFKSKLEDYTKASKQRIVIFVDELDRCRPDYAVKVLERIKNLFEVEGVVFVLALDKEQLRHSVKGLYGAGLNADVYLRRFIDFDYRIKEPDMGRFIDMLFTSMKIDQFLQSRRNQRVLKAESEEFRNTLALLAGVYGLTLRDAEQFLTRIVLVLCTLEDTEPAPHLYAPMLAFLVVARKETIGLYGDYIRDENDGIEMVKYWEEKLRANGIFEDAAKREVATSVTISIIETKRYPDDFDRAELRAFVKSSYENVDEKFPHASDGEKGYRRRVREKINTILAARLLLSEYVKKIEMLDQFRFPESKTAQRRGE